MDITQRSQGGASPSQTHHNRSWPCVARASRASGSARSAWGCSQERRGRGEASARVFLTRVRYPWCCWLRKRSTAATASAGFGRSPCRQSLPHHLHPDLPYSPCCVSWCSDMGRVAGAAGDGEHRQHSRTDLGVPARPATGVADSSLRCAPHIPAPHRWQTATAAREAHPVSTRQT
jgi:hypothetical protein